MKTKLLLLILLVTGLGLRAQTPLDAPIAPTVSAAPGGNNEVAGYNFKFQGVELKDVLDQYADLVGRTILRPAGLTGSPIVLMTHSPLTKSEAIEALQAVLAMNGIVVTPYGDKFLKVVTTADAPTIGMPFDETDPANLKDVGTVITHIVQLKYVKPSEMQAVLGGFAKLNSFTPLDSNGILVIRDYVENVKQMLDVIKRVDVNVPAEYVSEVIQIKYALATDIATALNSLGGSGGGSTVSIGSSTGTTGGNGVRPIGTTSTSLPGSPGYSGGTAGQPRPISAPVPAAGTTGAATGGTTGFQAQLQRIIARASGTGGTDQIQVFGQAKIIADTRSNSLLIFATRADLDAITNVIAKLDVLLSQVLIESVIMEVSLNKNLSFGVSAAQNPRAIRSPAFQGGGGFNNGPSFFNFITNSSFISSGTNSALAAGLSYFGQIGNDNYDVAVQAAESDDSINIIQKPRIQTFQAQAASFFVGNTVPYVTSTYNGIGSGGTGSSYSQLSVGVSLDVTPFINPDGLVVMQIQEQIDDITGNVPIDGNPVPTTASRHLSSNVAVKDRDSILLGGAIYSSKDLNKSGIPLLSDIPILGSLFSSRSSTKQRNELLVLIRPTVLRTPEIASEQAKIEEGRLPGIATAQAQDDKDEAKIVAAERKAKQLQDEKDARDAAKAAANTGKIKSAAPAITPPATVPAVTAPAKVPPATTGDANPLRGLY